MFNLTDYDSILNLSAFSVKFFWILKRRWCLKKKRLEMRFHYCSFHLCSNIFRRFVMGQIPLNPQRSHPRTCYTPATNTCYQPGAGCRCKTGVRVSFFVRTGGLPPLPNFQKKVWTKVNMHYISSQLFQISLKCESVQSRYIFLPIPFLSIIFFLPGILLIFAHYWMWKTWWCLRNPTGNACSPMFKHFSEDFVTGAIPLYPQKNSPLHLHWILHLKLTWQKALK